MTAQQVYISGRGFECVLWAEGAGGAAPVAVGSGQTEEEAEAAAWQHLADQDADIIEVVPEATAAA
jgi:hypothetical protein